MDVPVTNTNCQIYRNVPRETFLVLPMKGANYTRRMSFCFTTV